MLLIASRLLFDVNSSSFDQSELLQLKVAIERAVDEQYVLEE